MGSMLGGNQSSGTQQVVNKSEPWDQQKNYLTNVFARAQDLSNQPQQYFPGNTVVPFANETNQALNQITNTAGSQGGMINANNNQIQNTLNGNYLYGNPGFNAAFDAASRRIMPQINASAAGTGQVGDSSARDRLMAQTLGDSFAGLYGQERENQMRASALAPQAMQAAYSPAQQLLNVGGIKEQLAAQQMQDQISRFNFNQQEPINRLGMFNNFVQGNYGGTQEQTSPLYRNYAQGAIGGATVGNAIATQFPKLGLSGLSGGLLGGGLGLLSMF